MTHIADIDGSPDIRHSPPGPASLALLERAALVRAPMGPRRDTRSGIVYAAGRGSNVLDVDGNRYVDLAGGFGALLLGHTPQPVLDAVRKQSENLCLALGDVFGAETTIALQERLSALYPEAHARVVLAQSGADAVTAALKTAVLATKKTGIIAFGGAYHGLSYAPLAACGLRASYREPFAGGLNCAVTFVEYPADDDAAERAFFAVDRALSDGNVGAVLIEPILGRGGVVVPPAGFLAGLYRRARDAGALLVADEIWTGLGRSGAMLASTDQGVVPDLICLGKGLGGVLPISACIGSQDVMQSWAREEEVVHTSTFAGAPLACAAALATLDCLRNENLVARSKQLGARFVSALRKALDGLSTVTAVRGAGMMIGIELARAGAASSVQSRLLDQGYVVSTGGGRRETIVLTPPLTIPEELLDGFIRALPNAVA